MKHFLGTTIALFITILAHTQYTIKGRVVDEQNRQAVEAATISLERNGETILNTTTDQSGSYEFKGLKRKGLYQVIVEHVSLRKKSVSVDVNSPITTADFTLATNAYFLEPLEVKSLRASERAPFAKSNVSGQEIAKNNLGQDLPFLLNQTPSVVTNSDAGNGIGYTGIRIRGTDATRINVTINGIPYNDAESQGSFFVDLPDIASDRKSVV